MQKTQDAELARSRFFERQVHMKEWKDSMAGKNELRVMDLLKTMGYNLKEHYVRQYPIAQRYVVDIAFVREQVAVEVDDKGHNKKERVRSDKIRDKYLLSANWVTIRVQDSDLFGAKGRFYKYLIDEVVKERHEQYQKGRLVPIDFKRFVESDYE